MNGHMTYTNRFQTRPYVDRSPVLKPKEVVLANCLNSLENRAATGKLRPMLVVRRDAGHIRAVGLTRGSRFSSGINRFAIPNPTAQGLSGPGNIWGDRVTMISVLDVERHLGWADAEFLAVIGEAVNLSNEDRAALGLPPRAKRAA